MTTVITLSANPKFTGKFKNGFPLITKETIMNTGVLKQEGSIIQLVDQKNRFIAKGYYGRQNKGLGWLLTWKQEEQIDSSFFKSRIKTAMHKRDSFYQDPNTNAFRVFNGEGDGIGGLTIDFFAGYYLLTWYSEGIYQFKDLIIQAVDELCEYQAIYEKKRFDAKGKYLSDDDFVKGVRGEFPVMVKENGIQYAVYLNDGAMTGIFLDQRDVRRILRDKYAEGKNVLNTFSYTGAFSVAAALGGAVKTTSVDLAKRSKPKTIEQFQVNGLDHEQQDIMVMDVFDYFRYAKRKGLAFDVVVLDPPSFARSKKRTFSTAKDYPELIKDTIEITDKTGVIVVSTNNASFGMKKFKGFIDRAFKEMNAQYQIMEEYTLPKDFRTTGNYPQGNYLKVVIVKRK